MPLLTSAHSPNYPAKVQKITEKEAPEPLKFRGFMLNLKSDFFLAIERPFRFSEKVASFENARTFRFADYMVDDAGILQAIEHIIRWESQFLAEFGKAVSEDIAPGTFL